MITVLGSANMDLVARVPRLPIPGETILGSSFLKMPGGKGANQAVAAARAGSAVTFVGRVGRDSHGDELRKSLQESGVDLTYLSVDDMHPTGTALIWVDDTGENSIVVVPGANSAVSPGDVDRARDVIASSDILLLQLEVPLDTVIHAVRCARDTGTRVILNPAPAQPLPAALLQSVDVLIANRAEMEMLNGSGPGIEPFAAARMLRERGVSAVVVTLGVEGAVALKQGIEIAVPAFRVEAVDATGAGDAFAGNFTHALERGCDLERAVRFATASAALSVQHAGAQPAMPTSEHTERFMRERHQ